MLDRSLPSSARNAEVKEFKSVSQGEAFLDDHGKNGKKIFVALIVSFLFINKEDISV